MKKILFVCLGNICRSPAAEGIFQKKIESLGLKDQFFIDSAGTSGFHQGAKADARMREHAARRGYTLTSLSRQFSASSDFEKFDLIIPMDRSNFWDLVALDRPEKFRNKIKLMTDFCSGREEQEVPDPYYSGDAGFEQVLDILENGCEGLINFLKNEGSIK